MSLKIQKLSTQIDLSPPELWGNMKVDGILSIWNSEKYGTFVDGLFKMHDTLGYPLSFSLGECINRGYTPCLQQFITDAICAGWDRERALRMCREAIADSGAPQKWMPK